MCYRCGVAMTSGDENRAEVAAPDPDEEGSSMASDDVPSLDLLPGETVGQYVARMSDFYSEEQENGGRDVSPLSSGPLPGEFLGTDFV